MKQKLVSIIIPVYNGEKYIAQCLQSVREQSYNDFEVIIINDASPDNSQNIINKFVTDDDRFKVYVNEINRGGYVRHKGIDLACGEFLLFLDQDDWLTPRAIEILIKKISVENADIAYGALRSVFGPTTFIGKNLSNNCDKINKTDSIGRPALFDDYYISYFGYNKLRPSLLGNLYRADVISKAKINLRPFNIVAADLLLNMWIHPFLNKVCFVEDVVLNYRWGGMTNGCNPNYLELMKELYSIKK